MGFREMTDEEIKRYMEQYCPEQDNRNLYMELRQEIEEKVVQFGTLFSQMEKLEKKIEGKDIDNDKIYSSCMKISKNLAKLAKEMGMIPANYGIKNRNEYLRKDVIEEKSVQFTRDNGILHIKLPELLPHRPQYDTSTGKMRYLYDIDTWRAEYLMAFQKEFMNGKYRIYDDKVVLCFLHHVDRKKKMPDIDNLEVKVITDIIKMFLLTDDDHTHVCHCMDMVEDDSSYTEIIIYPYMMFMKDLKK